MSLSTKLGTATQSLGHVVTPPSAKVTSLLENKEKKGPISSFQDSFYRAMLASAKTSPSASKMADSRTPAGIGPVKQAIGKPAGPSETVQGKVGASGATLLKVPQKASPITHKAVVMLNPIDKAKLPMTVGRGPAGFKPYIANDPSAPSPIISPDTPSVGLTPKSDANKKAATPTAPPIKKIVEVIEISSSDDEVSSVQKSKETVSKGGNTASATNVLKITSVEKDSNLLSLLRGGQYQPASRVTVAPAKGGSAPRQRPQPTGIAYAATKPSSSGNSTNPVQKSVVAQWGNNTVKQRKRSKLKHGSDSDKSEKGDRTYEPTSDESSSDGEHFSEIKNRRGSKSKSQMSNFGTTYPVASYVEAADMYVPDKEPIKVMNAETGQIMDSDSQKSELVTDPEQLFFDVKDWLEDL